MLLVLRDVLSEPEREERRSFRLSRSFDSSVPRTPRALEVHKAFGIGIGKREHVIYRDLLVDVEPGDVVTLRARAVGANRSCYGTSRPSYASTRSSGRS